MDRWLLRRQSSCPVCKYRIRGGNDHDAEDTEDAEGGENSHADGEDVEQPTEEHPQTDVEVYEDGDAGDDDGGEHGEVDESAPLLHVEPSQSAPQPSPPSVAGVGTTWLSGGQLPAQGSTWLGYGESLAISF